MRHKAVLKIASVEKETGISKENLRIWEHRYGFPNPKRDANGERTYTLHQVEKLKLMKQLLDRGLSPKSIAQDSLEALKAQIQKLANQESKELEHQLGPIFTNQDRNQDQDKSHEQFHKQSHNQSRKKSHKKPSHDLQKILEDIKCFRKKNLVSILDQMFSSLPLEVFLHEFLSPLLKLVGQSWASGALSIEAEHFFSQVVQEKLIIYAKDLTHKEDKGGLLLTTPPGELHCLGLLMAQLEYLHQGYNVYYLGTQTPIFNIVQIVKNESIGIVGLGISEAFPVSKAQPYIQGLRALLPTETEIWLGGSGAKNLHISKFKNVKVL